MKVVVTGPECCGKSSLAAELAEHWRRRLSTGTSKTLLKAGMFINPPSVGYLPSSLNWKPLTT